MTTSSSRMRWLLVLFLLGGGLAALVLVGLGVWAGFAVNRAASVWPAELAPEVVPEPPLPVDPDARVRLDRLMERVPDDLDSGDLGEALQVDGPAELPLPDGLGPAFEAMDAVVECSGLQMESWGFTGEVPPVIDLLAISRARLLRAWRYAEADRPDEAAAEMLRTARLGLLLEKGGGNLLSAMVGVAIGAEAIGELVELVAWDSPPSVAMLATIAAEIEAASGLPSGLEHSILGECRGAESLYDDLRWSSREGLFAMADPVTMGAPVGAQRSGDGDCCFPFYDADRTIRLARHRCQLVAALTQLPGSQRRVPRFEPLAATGPSDLGAWLDNPVGRILLDVGTASYEGFMAKEDALRSRRAVVLAWLALQRWQRDHPGEDPPAGLEELGPDYLAAVPEDPWDGSALSYDPLQRAVWATRGSGDDGDPELRLEF
jgi:hypothetical protein